MIPPVNLASAVEKDEFPLCVYCVRFGLPNFEPGTCTAFPNGISQEIMTNQHDHRQPYTGDQDLLFEQDPDFAPAPPAHEKTPRGAGPS